MRRKTRHRIGWFAVGMAGTWVTIGTWSYVNAPGPQLMMLEGASPIHPVHLTADQRKDERLTWVPCAVRQQRAQQAGKPAPVCKTHHVPYWLRPHPRGYFLRRLLPWYMR